MSKYSEILQHLGQPQFRELTADLSDRERKELWAAYLENRHLWYIMQVAKKPASQNEFATWCGVSTASFSKWRNKESMPIGENQHRMATKLGPEVYDIIGVPRREPHDDDFRTIATLWPSFPDKAQKQLKKAIQLLAEKNVDGDMPDFEIVVKDDGR